MNQGFNLSPFLFTLHINDLLENGEMLLIGTAALIEIKINCYSLGKRRSHFG
jgi:hypothetical protein